MIGSFRTWAAGLLLLAAIGLAGAASAQVTAQTGQYSGVAGGVLITLTGSNLSNATVTVGGVAAHATTNTDSEIDFVTPSNSTGAQSIAVSSLLIPVLAAPGAFSVQYVPSPTISAAFSASSVVVGATATLTFTLTRQDSASGAYTSLGFTTSLPAGLKVASSPNASSTGCQNVSFSPNPGSTAVSLSGAKFPDGSGAGTTCTFQVDVVGVSGGVATVTPGGLVAPKAAIAGDTISGGVAGPSVSITVHNTPVIASVSPASGSAVSPAPVVIAGANFSASGNSVRFGGVAGSVTAESTTAITVTPPAHATGPVDVSVTNTDGETGTLASAYTYRAAPTISSVSPMTGPSVGGAAITISGTGLAAASAVTFGGVAGAVTSSSDTSVTVTAPPGSAGAANVVVTTSGGSATAVGAYTYVASPTAANVTAAVLFNSPGTVIPLNLTGGASTAVTVSTPSHGVAVVSGLTITYTPTAGYTGPDSFTYVATGVGGPSSPGTVSITVAPQGVPTLAAVTASTNFNTAVRINLASSITGAHDFISIASAPQHGTTAILGDVVTYTPTSGYAGPDSFTYSATVASGTAAPALVSITVNGAPVPVVSGASATVQYNTAKTIDLAPHISGVHTSTVISLAPAHGVATIAGDVVTYTPTASYYGADAFSYEAIGPGGPSAPASVAISISIPGAPTTSASAAVVPYGTAKAIDLSSAIGGVHSQVTITSSPSHGSAVVSGDVVTYTPTSGYYGGDVFAYTATGPGGVSSASAVTLTVSTPTAPTITATSAAVTYNTAKAIDLSSVIGGVHTAIAIPSAPSHGTTAISGDVVTYTPTANYVGSDSFTVTVTGPGGTSAPVTVGISVANAPGPVAADVITSTAYATAKAVDLAPSISGLFTAVTIATAPAHGSVSLAGSVATYTPASGYAGSDRFTYTATGPGGTSGPAAVSLTVANAGAPTAAGTAVQTAYNTAKTVDLSTLITGPHTGTVIAVAPTHGTASLSGDVVTYTPSAGYAGADSFGYTASNAVGTSAVATITVTIAAAPPPVVQPVSASIAYNTAKALDLSSLISGAHTSLAIASGPSRGSAVVSGDVVTYTPTTGAFGPDSFAVAATGPGGVSAPATISLTIASPGAPVASAVTASANFNTATPVILTSAISGVHTSVAVSTAPAHGAALVAGDAVVYTPATGFSGADSFAYTATGPGGTSAPALVTLSVGSAAPTAAADSATTPANQSVSIPVTQNDTGSISAIAVGAQPSHGSVAVQGLAAVYTPATDYVGTDSFTYVASGPGGAAAPATVTVTVTAIPVPTVSALTATAVAGQAVLLHPTASATGGPFTAVAISTTPSVGTATVTGQDISFTPPAAFSGTATLGFTVSNAYGVSREAIATVTVQAGPMAAAAPKTATVAVAGTAKVDLTAGATGGPFTAATIVSMTPVNAGTATIVEGAAVTTQSALSPAAAGHTYTLTFTANPQFSGAAVVTYTLANAYAVSPQAVVTFTVQARPDPSLNPTVRGLLGAMADSARRFARSQIANFNDRLERLHDRRSGAGVSNDVKLASGYGSDARLVPGDNPLLRRDANAAVAYISAARGLQTDATATAPSLKARGSSTHDPDGKEPTNWGVWADGSVEFGQRDSDLNRHGYHFNTDGLSAGVDYRISDKLTVGVGGGWGEDTHKVGDDGTKLNATTTVGAFYGSFHPAKSFHLDGVLGYGRLDYDLSRFSSDANAIATAKRSGDQTFGSLTGSWDVVSHGVKWSPYGRWDYASANLNAYTEAGAGIYSLAFRKQAVQTSTGSIGLRADTFMKLSFGLLEPRLRIEYAHDFEKAAIEQILYADLPNGQTYQAQGDAFDRNRLSLGFGADLHLSDRVRFGADYKIEAGENQTSHRIGLSGSVKF